MIQNVLFFCRSIFFNRHLLFHCFDVFAVVVVLFVLVIFQHTRTQIKHEKQMFGFSILNIYAYIRLIKFYSTATGHNDLFIDITMTISLWRLFDAIHLITQTNWRVWFVPTPIHTQTRARWRTVVWFFSFLFCFFLFLLFFCIFYFIVNVEVAPDAFLFSSISLTALSLNIFVIFIMCFWMKNETAVANRVFD